MAHPRGPRGPIHRLAKEVNVEARRAHGPPETETHAEAGEGGEGTGRDLQRTEGEVPALEVTSDPFDF